MADILLTLGVDTTALRATLQKTVPTIVRGAGVRAGRAISPGLEKAYSQVMERAKALPPYPKKIPPHATPKAVREHQKVNEQLLGTYQRLGTAYQQQQVAVDKSGKALGSFGGVTRKADKTLGGYLTQLKKGEKEHKTFGQALPLKRMILWGMGWMAVYGLFRKVINVIVGIIKTFAELDDAMARVGTVTLETGKSYDKVMGRMRKAVLEYSAQTRASITDVTKTMYFLGSAGLEVGSRMVGFGHIMDLTTGTLGNVDEVAKLAAGAFNIFGKSMRSVITDGEKFKNIADILAYTYACYSPDTEVLTDKGWKLFTALDRTETIATLNPKTKEIEYQKPTVYVNKPFKGKLCHLKGRFIDILVTPRHKLYTKVGHKLVKKEYSLVEAKNVFGRPKHFYRGSNWKGDNPKYFILPKVKNQTKNGDEKKIPVKNWVRFMAWYLSEGYCNYSTPKRKQVYRVVIYQSKDSKYRDDLIETLKLMPFKFYEDENKTRCAGFVICNKQLCEYLKQFGKSHEKYLPDFIKNLSPELLRLFIKTYIYGDGYQRNEKFGSVIVTGSKRLRDDFQEIALKANYGSTYCKMKGIEKIINNIRTKSKDIWHISINKKIEFLLDNKRNFRCAKKENRISSSIERWEDYNGRVVCAEVPNHIMFIRRKGKSFWCGNTQQVELSEVASAFTLVGSAAGLLEIDFETLVGTIGFLNTGMLKGTRAGTSLMNAFIQIARHADRLTEKLGIVFDITKPLNFVEIMDTLAMVIGKGAISTEELRTLMDIFGLRGARAVASILARFKDWKEAIGITDAKFSDFAEGMREKLEQTLPGALAKLGNYIKVSVIDKMKPFMDHILKIIEAWNKMHAASMEEAQILELLKVLGHDITEEAMKTVKTYEKMEKPIKELPWYGRIWEKTMKAIGKHMETFPTAKLVQDAKEVAKETGSIVQEGKILVALGIPDIFEQMRESAEGLPGPMGELTRKTKEFWKSFDEAVKAGKTEKEILIFSREELEKLGLQQLLNNEQLQQALIFRRKLVLEEQKLLDAAKELTMEDKRRLATVREEGALEVLRVLGARDYEILQAKIHLWFVKTAEKVNLRIKQQKEETELAGTLVTREQLLDFLMTHRTITGDELLRLGKEYGLTQKEIVELEKMSLELYKARIAKMMEMAGIFRTQIEESLFRIIKGTFDWREALESITDELLKLALKEIVHKVFLDFLGREIFDQAAMGMMNAGSANERAANVMKLASAEMLQAAQTMLSAATGKTPTIVVPKGAAPEVAGRVEGLEGLLREPIEMPKIEIPPIPGKETLENLPDVFDEASGKFTASLRTGAEDYVDIVGKELLSQRKGFQKAFEIGGKKGGKGLFTGLKEGLAKLQAPSAMGRMMGVAGGAMAVMQARQVGGAGGAMMGAMGGAMAGAQFGGAWGALAGGVVGGLMGLFGKKRSEETKHQTIQIASRIDVTNKQLEIANRNLSAMRRSFEGWGIMLRSAYFAEAVGPEARAFSLSSMRGYYG